MHSPSTATNPAPSPQASLFSPALLPRKLPVYKEGPEDVLPAPTRH